MKLNLNSIKKCGSILIQIGSIFLHDHFGTMMATASKYSRDVFSKGGGGGGGAVGGFEPRILSWEGFGSGCFLEQHT